MKLKVGEWVCPKGVRRPCLCRVESDPSKYDLEVGLVRVEEDGRETRIISEVPLLRRAKPKEISAERYRLAKLAKVGGGSKNTARTGKKTAKALTVEERLEEVTAKYNDCVSEMADMTEEISELEIRNEDLLETVADLESNIDDLEGVVARLEEALAGKPAPKKSKDASVAEVVAKALADVNAALARHLGKG